jgi:hypothetical protein
MINFTPAEVQSAHDRQRYAEGLILQLPKDHDGRNSWLLNFGRGEEARVLQRERGLIWSSYYAAAMPPEQARR